MVRPLGWPDSSPRLQGNNLDAGPFAPDDTEAGGGQAKMVGQGCHDLPVGFSLFRGSQHMHSIFPLAKLLALGFSGAGMDPYSQEFFPGFAFTLHGTPRLSL